jgi:CheY-like chemotaxis protein
MVEERNEAFRRMTKASTFLRRCLMSLPPRILYVDDDPIDCELMAFWLSDSCGYKVTSAQDGKQAAELIDSQTFDLFLLDYCLPDTTGVNLCRNIRAFDSRVPVIIYSALNRDIDRQRAMEAGANDYLVKPDELYLIRPHIDKLLDQSFAMRMPATDASISATSSGRASVAPRRKASGIV